MNIRPVYFNKEYKKKGYMYYKNEEDRVYVPENEKDYYSFINAAFKLVKRPTKEQKDNFELILKYPFLLPKNRWDKGLALFGDYCFDFSYTEIDSFPKGWFKSFGAQMLDEIKQALVNCKPEFLYQYMITDIKEKYGSLRWYDNGGPKGFYDIINKYQHLSETICFRCGEPATHFSKGWILPLCDACDNNINKKKESV